MPEIRIGTNPIAWSNDALPELGGDTPLATCLSEARQAGYSGIEMGGKFPRDAAELSRVLSQHGLRPISGWYSGCLVDRAVDDEWQAIQAHLELLARQGCQVLIYAETWQESFCEVYQPMSQRPHLDAEALAAYGAKLTQLADRCLARGVRLAVHHHLGTVIEDQAEIDALMAATGDSVGLLLDTGHCIAAGVDPLAVIRKHGPRICHVHCKDVRPAVLEQAKTQDMGFMEAVLHGLYTVPGDGLVDYAALLGALSALDYRGWLVVEAEQDPAKANPLEYATKGFRHLSRCAREAGFTIAG